MRKSSKDPMATMAKDSVIAAYRAKERALNWYERLEHLRGRSSAPFAIAMLNLGDVDAKYAGEELRGEVFAPFAADGGVIRIVWRSGNASDYYVTVRGFEDWLSDCLRSEKREFMSLGERILAERLQIEVSKRRPSLVA